MALVEQQDVFYEQVAFNRVPKDDDELWWTVYGLWGYKMPRTRVCPGHVSPFEAFADAFFARSPVAVWKASRGFGGKSRTLAILGLTELAVLGAEITVLGGSASQSLNVHETSKEAWAHHNAPRGLLARDPTQYDTYLTNGGHMRALMASQTSVRGPHPQRLRLDEIDEMDLDIFEAAQGQPMRKRSKVRGVGIIETQTVASSTHQYPDKTMTEILARARTNGWPVYEWCWRETMNPYDGWLTPDEVIRKRTEISRHMWETEYDLQEPSIEGRAIDTDAVERCFDEERGYFDGDRRISAERQHGREYITAVDWAKKQDMTIAVTFDTTEQPWQCVAWQKMNRQPWPMMIREAVRQWQKFGGKMVHDATGVGDVVDDVIKEIVPRKQVEQVKPIIMSSGRDRQNMFNEYIAAIEQDAIRYPRIKYAYDEHRYVTSDDLFGRGHPPDSVVAGALAWTQRRHRHVVGAPFGGVRASSPWQV